jgi:hypothetical protein
MLLHLGDLSSPRCSYTAGVIFRFFNRAFDHQPLELSHLFYLNESLMLLLLHNFSYPVVWQAIIDTMTSVHPEFAPLVLHLFASLYREVDPPADFLNDIQKVKLIHYVKPIKLTKSWPPPAVVLEVMGFFFITNLEDTDDFRIFVLKYLPKIFEGQDLPHDVWRFATRVVQGMTPGLKLKSNELVDRAIDYILKQADLRELSETEAFGLIAVWPGKIESSKIEGIVRKVLTSESAHFALRSVVGMVKKIGREGLEEIRGNLGRIVLECWNQRAENERIFATACLDICLVLEPEWAKEITERWKEMIDSEEPLEVDESNFIDFGRKFSET